MPTVMIHQSIDVLRMMAYPMEMCETYVQLQQIESLYMKIGLIILKLQVLHIYRICLFLTIMSWIPHSWLQQYISYVVLSFLFRIVGKEIGYQVLIPLRSDKYIMECGSQAQSPLKVQLTFGVLCTKLRYYHTDGNSNFCKKITKQNRGSPSLFCPPLFYQ